MLYKRHTFTSFINLKLCKIYYLDVISTVITSVCFYIIFTCMIIISPFNTLFKCVYIVTIVPLLTIMYMLLMLSIHLIFNRLFILVPTFKSYYDRTYIYDQRYYTFWKTNVIILYILSSWIMIIICILIVTIYMYNYQNTSY